MNFKIKKESTEKEYKKTRMGTRKECYLVVVILCCVLLCLGIEYFLVLCYTELFKILHKK